MVTRKAAAKKRSCAVPKEKIEALTRWKEQNHWTYLDMWLAMRPRFSHETLRLALQGFPVWKPHFDFLVHFEIPELLK